MNKHTPGPWFNYGKSPEGYVVGEFPGDGPLKGVVAYVVGTGTLAAEEANARLTAAAPELLEALREAHTALYRGCETPEDKEGLLKIIEETIAKAEGR
jgi:hypothetical protein